VWIQIQIIDYFLLIAITPGAACISNFTPVKTYQNISKKYIEQEMDRNKCHRDTQSIDVILLRDHRSNIKNESKQK
jgi:hypothetical protein